MTKKITLVYPILRSFVKSDIKIFEAHGYEIFKLQSFPDKKLWGFFKNRVIELLVLPFYILKSKVVFSWFNDYHSFLPILISKLLFKKSVIIVGGYDAIVDNKNQHGVFYNSGMRALIAKLNYRLVSEVWVVHKSLEYGCSFAKKEYNIISGVRSFISKKGIKIKEINTGYDSRFWNYNKSSKKSGILTAAFFYEERVINIKGLKIFNKLASLLPEIDFTIVGESGIKISDYINIEKNVKILGVMNKYQMKELYQNSKFYFQGSRLEGLPNSLCEAMLCGCIPIGSRVFGIPDAIGDTGILFDSDKNLDRVVQFINSDFGSHDFKKARKRIKNQFHISLRSKKIKENI